MDIKAIKALFCSIDIKAIKSMDSKEVKALLKIKKLLESKNKAARAIMRARGQY